jgi:hypothetical protein
MDAFTSIVIALLIAHAAGDFVLQRRIVVAGKRRREWKAYLEHGAIHLVTLIVAWPLFAAASLPAANVAAAFAIILITHLACDWIKETTAPGGGAWTGPGAYLLDQLFHTTVIVLVAAWLAGFGEVAAATADFWRGSRAEAGVLIVGYLLIVFGAGYLNGLLLRNLAPPSAVPVALESDAGPSAGLGNAGLYIGWLERFLMLTAVLLESPAALGLILAAKSIFRFDDIRQGRASTEYFLIGTLVSVAQAVAGGLAVRWLLLQLGS